MPFLQWSSQNRLRTGVPRCRFNIKLWGFDDYKKCGCGMVQNPEHLMTCPHLKLSCMMGDLILVYDKATYVTDSWKTDN